MPTIILPHSNGVEVPAERFLALWVALQEEAGFEPAPALIAPMPRLSRNAVFEVLLEHVPRTSLDVLCRLLPGAYRNVKQASGEFMTANAWALRPVECTNPLTGRDVLGASLTQQAKDLWPAHTPRQIEVFIQAARQSIRDGLGPP